MFFGRLVERCLVAGPRGPSRETFSRVNYAPPTTGTHGVTLTRRPAVSPQKIRLLTQTTRRTVGFCHPYSALIAANSSRTEICDWSQYSCVRTPPHIYRHTRYADARRPRHILAEGLKAREASNQVNPLPSKLKNFNPQSKGKTGKPSSGKKIIPTHILATRESLDSSPGTLG